MKQRIALASLLAALALAGCASQEQAKVNQAATTPLNDLNLVNAEIPAPLLEAAKAPYALPADRSCPALAQTVHTLDEVLGPDLDAPHNPNNPGLVERSGELATGALQNAAENVVPFRGWVRKITGAERYSKKVAAAIAAGTVRRAFVKGLAKAGSCA
jgi:outer membrane murein-binding lipoprotein Lpp